MSLSRSHFVLCDVITRRCVSVLFGIFAQMFVEDVYNARRNTKASTTIDTKVFEKFNIALHKIQGGRANAYALRDSPVDGNQLCPKNKNKKIVILF